MNIRLLPIILLAAALGGISFLNWNALVAASDVSLGITTVQAPLGLILLVLAVLLSLLFLAYILWLQGTVLVENRRHNKEMHAQRELADKAEASRFTELREFLVQQHADGQAQVQAELQALEQRLLARIDEADNSNAAYWGQLEHQLRTGSSSQPPVQQPAPPATFSALD